MGKKLAKYVHVVDEDGRNVVLEPGSSVPSWAKDQVVNQKAFEEVDDEAVVVVPPPSDPDKVKPLKEWTVKDLKAEVDSRNEGREDDAKIVVGGKGNKSDLAKALEADNAAQQ